jgi:hypothetical protein
LNGNVQQQASQASQRNYQLNPHMHQTGLAFCAGGANVKRLRPAGQRTHDSPSVVSNALYHRMDLGNRLPDAPSPQSIPTAPLCSWDDFGTLHLRR